MFQLRLVVILMTIVMGGSIGNSQDITIDSLKCKLEEYRMLDSFKRYYEVVHELERTCVFKNKNEQLKQIERYYDFLPNTEKDSTLFRQQLIRHAYKIQNELNQIYKSNMFYEKAYTYLQDKNNLDNWCNYGEKNLADNYARLNNFDKSIFYNKLCLKCYKQHMKEKVSRIYSDLGDLYNWIGDSTKMKECYDQGIHLAIENSDLISLQAIHLGYANYYLGDNKGINRLTFARKHIELSNKFLVKLKSDKKYGKRKSDIIEAWGDYYYQWYEVEKAEDKYREAIEVLENNDSGTYKRERAKKYSKLAHIFYKNGNYEESEKYIDLGFEVLTNIKRKGLPKRIEIRKENTLTDLIELKALLYWSKSNLGEEVFFLDSILNAIDLAIYSNGLLDHDIEFETSKYLSARKHKELVNIGIKASYAGYNKTGLAKYSAKARELFSKSKGRIFQNKRNRMNKYLHLSEEDKEAIDICNQQIINLLDYDNVTSGNSDSFDLLYRTYYLKIDSVFSKKEMEVKEFETFDGPYLDYVLADSIYYLYTNIGTRNFHKLGHQKDIEEMILSLFFKLDNKIWSGLDKLSEQLHTSLIPIDLENLENINILPDGMLTILPFDVLENRKKNLLSEVSYTIQYNIYKSNEEKKGEVKEFYVLQPEYPLDRSEYTQLTRGGLNHLPYAKEEVGILQSLFGVKEDNIDNWVSTTDLPSRLSEREIFHYAGHAIADEKGSYLALVKNGEIYKITSEQIKHMTNSLELATLSACETGLGQFRVGEGMKSLASSFMESGANSVLYSLWEVEDNSTNELIKLFYGNIKKGMRKDVSLQRAKLQFIEETSPEKRHPYYWSGFVIAGDVSSIEMSSCNYMVFVIVAFILLISFWQVRNN